MGSAASVESARGTMSNLLTNKPLDASDITDLEKAKAEIRQLRALAKDFETRFRDELKEKAGKNAAKKREAVMDKPGAAGVQIDTATYVPKLIDKPKKIRDLLFSIVTSNNLFKSYASEEHSAIVDAFEPIEFPAGENVITQGESGDNFYVVQFGTLDIFIGGESGEMKVGSSLGPGSCFGELALMYNTPRAATVRACDKCSLWQINRQTYRGILVYYKYLRNKQYLEFLKNVSIGDKPLGSVLSPAELEQMAISLEKSSFEKDQKILIQGNTGDEFFIILEGSVSVYVADKDGKETKVTTLGRGSYFGEKALLNSEVRGATCIADGAVSCLTLEREEFLSMFGSFEELQNKDRSVPEPPPVSVETNDPGSFSMDISLSDLEIKATLGCGAFGRVRLCRYVTKDQFFALKCQSKRGIAESGLQEHVLQEMRVMRRIDHPFIAKLYSALQDNIYIYFLLELLQGGELFTHLRNRGKLSEQAARFYGATVVYAFTTLHSKKIAYRDLKPENLVMDSNGFIKLVDFGLAKQLLSGKTWTLCGTPDYLAPEIILNEGHDLAVDYWALGVLLYEMVVGAPPFYAEDPMEVYEKILSGNPSMPSFFTRNLSDLIKKLLRSQQAKRLGNTRGGTASVVKHKWFSTFEWALLESGEAKTPYKPNVASRDDVANFDQFDEGETPVIFSHTTFLFLNCFIFIFILFFNYLFYYLKPTSDWMPDLYN